MSAMTRKHILLDSRICEYRDKSKKYLCHQIKIVSDVTDISIHKITSTWKMLPIRLGIHSNCLRLLEWSCYLNSTLLRHQEKTNTQKYMNNYNKDCHPMPHQQTHVTTNESDLLHISLLSKNCWIDQKKHPFSKVFSYRKLLQNNTKSYKFHNQTTTIMLNTGDYF